MAREPATTTSDLERCLVLRGPHADECDDPMTMSWVPS